MVECRLAVTQTMMMTIYHPWLENWIWYAIIRHWKQPKTCTKNRTKKKKTICHHHLQFNQTKYTEIHTIEGEIWMKSTFSLHFFDEKMQEKTCVWVWFTVNGSTQYDNCLIQRLFKDFFFFKQNWLSSKFHCVPYLLKFIAGRLTQSIIKTFSLIPQNPFNLRPGNTHTIIFIIMHQKQCYWRQLLYAIRTTFFFLSVKFIHWIRVFS